VRALLALGVITISGFLGTGALSQTLTGSAQLALVGGSIYTSPTEQPIRDGAVLIDGGKIVSVIAFRRRTPSRKQPLGSCAAGSRPAARSCTAPTLGG
jgi:hypothetical protein